MNLSNAETQINEAISSLIRSRTSEEGTVVSLPSVYPSGAPVQIQIRFDGETFFVSDMGNAHGESELIGATNRLFNSNAREVAEEFGVGFDNQFIFALHVAAEKLNGALRIVGAASLKTVTNVEAKLSEQKDSSIREDFVDRLIDVFGKNAVAREVQFRGSSTHNWNFAAQVNSDKGLILFDTASDAPLSIYGAHAKFSDVRLLEHSPRGIIGISSFKLIKSDYRNLLQQVANVVEVDASTDVLKRFKAA